MFRTANNLYNVGLYNTRQTFFGSNGVTFLSYNELYEICKTNENYSLLPAKASQQILKEVEEATNSFQELVRKAY